MWDIFSTPVPIMQQNYMLQKSHQTINFHLPHYLVLPLTSALELSVHLYHKKIMKGQTNKKKQQDKTEQNNIGWFNFNAVTVTKKCKEPKTAMMLRP